MHLKNEIYAQIFHPFIRNFIDKIYRLSGKNDSLVKKGKLFKWKKKLSIDSSLIGFFKWIVISLEKLITHIAEIFMKNSWKILIGKIGTVR